MTVDDGPQSRPTSILAGAVIASIAALAANVYALNRDEKMTVRWEHPAP